MSLRLAQLVSRFATCLVAAALLGAQGSLVAQEPYFPPLPTGSWQEGGYTDDTYGDDTYDDGNVVGYDGYGAGQGVDLPSIGFPRVRLPSWDEIGIRHSSTHGRAFGRGGPLSSTSWLNRPYEFGLETGAFVMTERFTSNTSRNNDIYAAAHLGWDWDHYWGTQFRLGWTTPELTSSSGTNQPHTNGLLMVDLSMVYYPWGDSRVRPYYRLGLGLTDVDFTNPAGVREDNTLMTFPVAIGIKYQTKRWMAFRAEATDHIVWGQNSARGVQNLTFTFGLEWRFGGRPSGTWSSPSQRSTW